MKFMTKERQLFDGLLPGLSEAVRKLPFAKRESVGSPVVELFRDYGGAKLLVPREYGGRGIGPLAAVAIHGVLGSLSPSMAVAATMHNFTLAFLADYAVYGEATKRYLREIGERDYLLTSGFAEGKRDANILQPVMKAIPRDGGYVIAGSKKPCSISESMDYLTASVSVCDAQGQPLQRAIAIVPAAAEGIERHPFWQARSLGGAQTAEVRLNDVYVERSACFYRRRRSTWTLSRQGDSSGSISW